PPGIAFPLPDDRKMHDARRPGYLQSRNSPMLTRKPVQIARPWIKRPRGVALLLAAAVLLTDSTAFAQRGGAGRAGMSGGASGSGGAGGAGSAGLVAGFGGGAQTGANPAQMMIAAQQMQALQDPHGFMAPIDGAVDRHSLVAARRAFRAEQLAQRKV